MQHDARLKIQPLSRIGLNTKENVAMKSILELRDARNELDREEIHWFLDQLLDLRKLSDPKNCDDPATLPFGELTGKNATAEWAVFMARPILIAAAGWAINHKIGRALPSADAASADDREHEIAGNAEASVFTGTIRDQS